jgi:hypothetical protein
MKQNIKEVFKAFSIELPLYGILMLAYAFLVLHYLGAWLFHLFESQRVLYSVVALGLIVGQGFGLELLARSLLALINGKKDQ